MKNKEYTNYIGRYFKMNINIGYSVFKILDYDGKHFITDHYHLKLGSSTKEINCRYLVSFLDADNFEEITESEFMTIVSLCDNPYVVEFDENDVPHYIN